MKVAQFTNHTKDSDWETLAQHRMIAHLFAVFNMYSRKQVWKGISNRLQRPYYLSRIDHV
jgi:hypothetical protein